MMRKTILAAALAALPLLASAQVFQATAPAPVPDPTAQQGLSTAATTNGTATYNGATAFYYQQAYQAAANTAQDISNQDAQNVGNGYGSSDAWQEAADQAQTVANQNQSQADAEVQAQTQAGSEQSSSLNSATDVTQPTAQSNSTAAQSAANQGSSQSFADISSQTGVPQGQPTVTNNTGEYIIAGAATQALMNGLATTGYQANISAYQDAQNAASCGNPGCAAGWMAANAVEQNIANGAYAGNVAAAPVMSAALNVAAAASALKSAQGTLSQISSMTGVAQGQTAGSTNAQDAFSLTSAQTGVQQGQPQVGTDTSYTSAADSQQTALGAVAQQNQNAAINAAQAWQYGLSAEYSQKAAQSIADYDNSQAQATGDPNWTSAAQIAQNEVTNQSGIYTAQQTIQNQNIATGNATATQANAMAPDIGNTLNTAAQNSATTQASATLQNIGAQTGVAQ